MSNTFNSDGTKCNENADENIIEQCDHLKRSTYALKFYKNNKNTNNKSWHKFCLNVYGNKILDDYHHLLSKHQNNIDNIKNELIDKYGFSQCLVKDCQFIQRHFDEFRRDTNEIETEDNDMMVA
eukprot:448346_1